MVDRYGSSFSTLSRNGMWIVDLIEKREWKVVDRWIQLQHSLKEWNVDLIEKREWKVVNRLIQLQHFLRESYVELLEKRE